MRDALARSLLFAVVPLCVVARGGAQRPTASDATPVRATPVERSTTAAMMAALDGLAPAAGWLGTPDGLEPFVWEFYRDRFGLAPADNTPDVARIALGRTLFFDKRLSADRSLSCASCHDPLHGFAEPRPTSIGVGGAVGGRNAPTVLNAALQRQMFWDGRAKTLEEQALLPIVNPIEMGLQDLDEAVRRVAEVEEYRALFDLAYDQPVTAEGIGKALAAFQRTLVFLDSPFDRYRAGDQAAISKAAKRGFDLFVEHQCTACHAVSTRQPLFSDQNFHNTGIAARTTNYREVARSAFALVREGPKGARLDELALEPAHGELGRALVTRMEFNVGAFRTPQLRNVGVTAPYMHDGSAATLWDVVDHYNRGGVQSPWLDPAIRPLGMSEDDVDAMVAFLFTLTDQRLAARNDAEQLRQRAIAQRERPFRTPAADSSDPGSDRR